MIHRFLQLGHMRTNKKCPLYNEEGEPVAWQDLGAAADGLLERQGTKITIKRKSIPTKKMEELDSPKSVQPPLMKTPLPKKDVPVLVPLLKTPSLRIKLKSGATPTQSTDNSPAPSGSIPPKGEKVHGAHANGGAETPGASHPVRPPLKLKLSNQKLKEQAAKRFKQDVDVDAARKERERIRERERQEREAYEQALVEEREREEKEREEKEREREKNIERREREQRELMRRATGVHTNEAASARGNKVENKLVFVNKAIKKKIVRAKDDPELLRRREREREQAERMERERERREAEEYQRALEEELRREEEELERKERAEREERVRMERERQRQQMKEKEKRRERERIREEARAREAAELEAQRAAQEREERERLAREEELLQQQRERDRIRQKNLKFKHVKERTKAPTSGLSEKERGKGIKRRPDPPPPSYHHTPDYGSAPKRQRKKGGEVSFSTNVCCLTFVFDFIMSCFCRRHASVIPY